jgi:hypothetical protein
MTRILGILALLFASSAAESPDHLAQFRFFVGEWTGHETGYAGIGKGERSYELIMNGRYLFQKNVSRFEPQDKNPEGEVHEDWAFFSYDKTREKYVLREFHSEGFVNQYTLEESGDGRFVFVSEAIENVEPGFRARVTLTATSGDSFDEVFELAHAGKDFEPILKNRWMRVKVGR